jgi:AcrR family transcriptional regulator
VFDKQTKQLFNPIQMKKEKAQLNTAPSDDTRGKLLQAAMQVFSDCGYEGATIRMICRKAGVNVAMVNYHFGDKLELYRTVVRYAMDADSKVAMVRHAMIENADPALALRQIIHGALSRLSVQKQESGQHMWLMLQEIGNQTAVLVDEVEAGLRPLYDQLRLVVGRVLGLPMDHVKTRLCTHSLIGQISHYMHARPILTRLWPEMKMSPKEIEMIANHIADFSLSYMQAVPGNRPNRNAQKSQRKTK